MFTPAQWSFSRVRLSPLGAGHCQSRSSSGCQRHCTFRSLSTLPERRHIMLWPISGAATGQMQLCQTYGCFGNQPQHLPAFFFMSSMYSGPEIRARFTVGDRVMCFMGLHILKPCGAYRYVSTRNSEGGCSHGTRSLSTGPCLLPRRIAF